MKSFVRSGRLGYLGRGRPRNPFLDEVIQDAAMSEFIENGFSGVTAHSVAKRAGVGRAAIGRRYFNMIDLVSEAILHMSGVLPVEKSRHVFRDLRSVIENGVKAAERGNIPRLMAASFMEESRHPEFITMYRKAVGWPRRRMVREVLESGLRGDLVRRDIDLDVAVDMIIGAAFERRFAGLYFGEHYTHKVMEILLRGILRSSVAPHVSIDYGE